jgi:hypothetical protein
VLREPTEAERAQRLASIYGGAALKTPDQFRRYKRRYFAAAAVWVIALVIAVSLVPGWWRLAVAFVFMLVTPAARDLTQRYDDYRREWEIGQREQQGAAGPLS